MTTKRKATPAGNPPSAPSSAEDDIPTIALEVVNSTQLQAMETIEIDRQIATAKHYPRDITKFLKSAESLATSDEDVAESCIYDRPVGKKLVNGRMVMMYASGMSVRLAEIAAATYQNIRVAAVLIEKTPRFVRARGYAFDVENNLASSSEAIESTVTREGTPYSERMQVVAAKACLSKARRDAIFQVIPRSLLKPVEIKVREILAGDRKTLEERRKKALAWIDEMQIGRDRVFAALDIHGEKGLDVRKLEILTGLRTAIRDGDITIDEAFAVAGNKKADEAAKTAAKPLFTGPAGQPAATTTSGPDSGSTSAPTGTVAKPTGSESPKKDYSDAERTKIIDDLKNRLLDLQIPEEKAFKFLKRINVVPDGVDELFALPTAVLDAFLIEAKKPDNQIAKA